MFKGEGVLGLGILKVLKLGNLRVRKFKGEGD